MALSELIDLVAGDPAIVSALGRSRADLAVAEAAQPIVLASISAAGRRRPMLVVTATTHAAERLAGDLSTWLGEGEAEVFPAWETLPFERVSPGVETMGIRMRLLWQLRAGRPPAVVVVPVRALLQRLSPSHREVEPIEVTAGDQLDMAEFAAELVRIGYRRDGQVEHRGDFAIRGSIIDVYPSTAHGPVRIDLWGDEVERLTEFAVADQRSTDAIATVQIFPCREIIPNEQMQVRAEQLMGESPWGREQWQRYVDGQFFDGMESWLPWFDTDTEVVGDLLGGDAHVVLIEPNRLRRRAEELLAEEEDLASTLAVTWGATEAVDKGLARLHTDFDRGLSSTDAPVWSLSPTATGPHVPTVEASGWDRPIGEDRGPIPQLRRLLADGYRAVVAADGSGTANRIHTLLGEQGLDLAFDPEASFGGNRQAHVVVAPLVQGCVLPSLKLAILAEPELTGRRRAHRRSRRRAQRSADLEDLKAGSYVVHRQHGIARYSGMETRAIGGVERDYLVLEYRGTDRLYLPSDQIDAIRHYTGGDSPTLSRMGGADWQKAKARVKSAVAEVAQELVVLYQQRVTTRGHSFGPDTPWQAELEGSFAFQETP